jgi:Allene oxide cyclase
MKRLLSMVVAVAAIIVLAIAVAASGKRSATPAKGDRVITVIEHATTDTTTDTGAAGDSAGDVLTFANNVFDAADARKVGTDQGYCIRAVAGVSYQCTWTTSLAGGQIVVAGPFYDAKDSNLAITGGTGRYRNARGTMKLHARANGTKFAFAFHVIG